jgi:hypothetical protein
LHGNQKKQYKQSSVKEPGEESKAGILLLGAPAFMYSADCHG